MKAEDDLSVTMRLVRQASLEMSLRHPYRMYLEMIIEKCRPAGYDKHRVGEGEPNVKTYEDLVALHFKVLPFRSPFSSSCKLFTLLNLGNRGHSAAKNLDTYWSRTD